MTGMPREPRMTGMPQGHRMTGMPQGPRMTGMPQGHRMTGMPQGPCLMRMFQIRCMNPLPQTGCSMLRMWKNRQGWPETEPTFSRSLRHHSKERQDRIQTGPEKKRSMIPFIAAGAAVLVVIAALVFFLGSSGSKTDSSYQAGSEGSTGSKKSSGSNFAKITIVCPSSSMHVGETMPIFVKAGDKVYFAASPNITWSVDNTSVAYISTEGDGALVGVSEGKVKVTAEINGITDSEVMNLHPHAVLIRVLWRWYQNLRAF